MKLFLALRQCRLRCRHVQPVPPYRFSTSRSLCFALDDRIMSVYRALYPCPQVMADCQELETFVSDVREQYGVDLLPLWREGITLGELFAHATRAD